MPFSRLLSPLPLRPFEQTLISSFPSALCFGLARAPPTIGDGISEFSAYLFSDGPIGEPGDSWGTEHLSYGAWILKLAGFVC